MSEPFRVGSGINADGAPVRFKFNNRSLTGRQGDTLAAALLANGQRLVGRSFKYHRPRGIFSAGPEEPNALVEMRTGAHREPNTRATTIELFEGLEATSQNHRGSLERDALAVNDLLSPYLTAGFYYKTFMWPKSFWEKVYEPMIRAAAGLGRLSMEPDPDHYDKGFLHCDVLVVGAGPAGLSAAQAAGRAGARVILADEDFVFGGRLNAETLEIDDKPGSLWARDVAEELKSLPNVRLLPRTTVYGAYDHGVFGALERKTDHLPHSGGKPRQILWRIYSTRSVVCAGATERPIAFPGNDRPGVMLAGAARCYLNRFGVSPGSRIAVFTNNSDGWRTAEDFESKRIEAVIIDAPGFFSLSEPRFGIRREQGDVVSTSGRRQLGRIRLSDGTRIDADCLAVSGGWNPNVHLTCHHRGRPVWREDLAAFVPGGELPPGMLVAGAANGTFNHLDCIAEGTAAGSVAAESTGHRSGLVKAQSTDEAPGLREGPVPSEPTYDIKPYWQVGGGKGRAWVDHQNDVTVKDIELSFREGMHSVEHLKRYTTLGMATDQGKTANVLALAIMAGLTGKTIQETGTTIYRPPYTPVPIAAFAGRSRGREFRPVRLTPSHIWAEERGAVFVEAGNWMRAQWYPIAGETRWRESVDREVRATRGSVGICDVTTLGKIDIQGQDAAELLNRVYSNGFSTLPVGKVRYGLMLREDGIAYDDGTTARLGEHHYLMTTTTANAVLVFRNLEFARQCLWPGLDVHLISVTDGWAQFAVAGPNSRKLLRKIIDPEHDISNQAFPFMACGPVSVCGGVGARLFRISFSGELAYEIAVPARYGRSMMAALMSSGEEFGAVPYGTEALGVMRIEKGHAAGNELNGQTTAYNLGLGRMVSQRKDCIGNVLSRRPEMLREDAVKLAGFRPIDRARELRAGAHFIERGASATTENDLGWMSSVAYSPTLGHHIGLGFIRRGSERYGDIVVATDPLRDSSVEVEVVSPHFFDPDGERLRA